MARDSRPCVILGVAPSRLTVWHPLSPSSIRLAELIGVDSVHLSDLFALDDLVSHKNPGRKELKRAATLYKFESAYRYILAGTEVVRALGKRALADFQSGRSPFVGWRKDVPWSLAGAGPLSWYESREGVMMAILPHPSPRNHWYDDKRCWNAAQRFLASAVCTRGAAHQDWLDRSGRSDVRSPRG